MSAECLFGERSLLLHEGTAFAVSAAEDNFYKSKQLFISHV
jgi:hypothetical protein